MKAPAPNPQKNEGLFLALPFAHSSDSDCWDPISSKKQCPALQLSCRDKTTRFKESGSVDPSNAALSTSGFRISVPSACMDSWIPLLQKSYLQDSQWM